MFKPCNRHLCVEVFQPDVEDNSSSVLLPDDYQPAKSVEAVRLLSKSSDSTLDASCGSVLVVESHMIKSVDLGEETVHLILENYVLGVYGGE